MSQPPPPSYEPQNPDRRPLPEGWIAQFDSKSVCSLLSQSLCPDSADLSPQLQDMVRRRLSQVRSLRIHLRLGSTSILASIRPEQRGLIHSAPNLLLSKPFTLPPEVRLLLTVITAGRIPDTLVNSSPTGRPKVSMDPHTIRGTPDRRVTQARRVLATAQVDMQAHQEAMSQRMTKAIGECLAAEVEISPKNHMGQVHC
jgi:hypothetical protein